MREIKFRAWDTHCKYFIYFDMSKPMFDDSYNTVTFQCDKVMGDHDDENKRFALQQYTGLKDKNGLQEVYEGDIIDEYGNIKGNIYEMDAGETDFIIQGFGDKNWGATYQNAVDRGCKDSE